MSQIQTWRYPQNFRKFPEVYSKQTKWNDIYETSEIAPTEKIIFSPKRSLIVYTHEAALIH